jgi:hypothetical protein
MREKFILFADLSFPEQRIGGAAMAGGKGDFAFATGDFGFQGCDAGFQLVNRQRVQILPDQQSQRIITAEG